MRNLGNDHNALIIAVAALTHAVLEHAVTDVNDPKADDALEHAVRAFTTDYANFASEIGLTYRLRMVKA